MTHPHEGRLPRVTVVTPTFNRAHLLPFTVSSVLGQSFEEFEYIIIDDGSTDGTEAVLRQFADPRIAFLRHENRGEAATTNRGWAMARGEYFAVLSSDDLVKPQWLARMVRFMDENPEILVGYPDYEIIDSQGRVTSVAVTPTYSREGMIAACAPSPGVGAVIRRTALRDLHALRNPEYRFAPDLDSWLRLSLRGPFARLGEVLGAWRDHEGSITVRDRTLARGIEMLRIAHRFFKIPDLSADIMRLRPFAMAHACSSTAYVLAEKKPLSAAFFLRLSYAFSATQPDFIPAHHRRPPRPGPRRFLRLVGASLRHRAIQLLRRTARHLPAGARHSGRALLTRMGLLPKAPDVVPQPEAPDPVRARITELMPQIRADLAAFRDTVGVLSPAPAVLDLLAQRATAPAAPYLMQVMARVFDAFPDRMEHTLVLPWVSIIGGSETVTARLIEALCRLRGAEGLCVIAPDSSYTPSGARSYHGLPFLGLSDLDPSLDAAARADILDCILVQRRPKVMHSVNSLAAWQVIRERGRYHAADIALFGNIYSDIRLADGVPAAPFYYDFLPHCIEHLAGVMADNHAVLDRAAANFGFGPGLRAKMHVVRTPVVGLNGSDTARDMRTFRPMPERRSLWLSRLAPEKRLDVLAQIAARCPSRRFDVRGADNGLTPDLSVLRSKTNLAVLGPFGGLDEIRWDDYDSYVFTTSGEGMPISLLEIAVRGLPMVAPAVGGIGEFLTAETGWLVSGQDKVDEYVDALAQIEDDPEEAARRVAAAQALLLREYSRDAFDATLRAIPRYLGERR